MEYAFEDFDKELEDYRKFFREMRGNDEVEVLVAKPEDRVVGFLALWVVGGHDEQVRSIGVSVHPNHWRRGIATKLAKESIKLARALNVRKLVIETVEENVAMRRVTEKLGFELECVRKGKLFKTVRGTTNMSTHFGFEEPDGDLV